MGWRCHCDRGSFRTTSRFPRRLLLWSLAIPSIDGWDVHRLSIRFADFEPTIGIAISGLAAGSVATLGILWIGVFLRRNTMFRIVDQYAGGVAGLCSSVVGVALVFWVVLAAEPTIRQSREIADRNEMLSLGKDTRYVALIRLTEFIDATKKSYVMVGLRSWNPFVDVAYIRDLKKQIETSLDPARWNSETNGGILGSIPKLIRAPTTPPVQQP